MPLPPRPSIPCPCEARPPGSTGVGLPRGECQRLAVEHGSGELALAAICCPKSLSAQTIFKRIALSNLGVALPAQRAYRDSDDAFPLVVFLYSIGFSVAYRVVRYSLAPGWLQARRVDHAVTLDIRIRVKFSSQVNITDIDAGSMTGADVLGRVGQAWGRPF